MPELIDVTPGPTEWEAARDAGAFDRRPLKLSPWSRIGMIHGAYAAAYPPAYPIASRAYRYPELAASWQYRRGFAHAALAAREVHHGA